MKKSYFLLVAIGLAWPAVLPAQHEHGSVPLPATLEQVLNVDPQPLLSQAIRLEEALNFLGSSLSADDAIRLKELKNKKPEAGLTKIIQEILDPYCLAMVAINPEARVKVARGPAKPVLIQKGWTSFLIKVHNEAGSTAKLEVQSANAEPLLHRSTGDHRARAENLLTPGQVANRFLEMQVYRNRPLEPNLSGLALEYAVLQIYCREKGQKEGEIGFHIGQGTQDIGFRNAINILFTIKPSVHVTLHVVDDNGMPAMASFVIKDGIERILEASAKNPSAVDYRTTIAQMEYGTLSKKLSGIYPLPSRRVATSDEYPDFFFQPQVYRSDGEHVELPPGTYQVTFTRGPEYLPQTKQLTIPTGIDSVTEFFRLKRWIDMAKLGWFSGDHHVHAAGCSHYESPAEGVEPADMFRQALGEDLKVSTVLTWGPSWYNQKKYFTGNFSPLSTGQNIMRYDVEVSGFPSSHAGHVVLLDLKEDDYPGTTKVEEWPSWTLPVMQWAKAQGGVTGYAHSGWGLEPMQDTKDLPNYVMPKMDGIGANEYVVTVTQNAVDMFSAGDTPAPWELNMWYHSLNCGYRVRLSGETDFPCIFDERVGVARSYFKSDNGLAYPNYIDAIKKGRSYISDGTSHIIDFSVNGLEMGTQKSEVALRNSESVVIKAKVAAYLSPAQDEDGLVIAQRPLDDQPYWNIERARIKQTRRIPVELIVNGESVDTVEVVADGNWKEVNFSYPVKRSSWIALRIYPSSHTNPIFVIADGKPIVIRKSAAWCRDAVDQCWKMKRSRIHAKELAAAEAAYNKARAIYDKMILESR